MCQVYRFWLIDLLCNCFYLLSSPIRGAPRTHAVHTVHVSSQKEIGSWGSLENKGIIKGKKRKNNNKKDQGNIATAAVGKNI